ncbi:hypothetical protein RFI_33616, partial [Reticulomyxa filosa]
MDLIVIPGANMVKFDIFDDTYVSVSDTNNSINVQMRDITSYKQWCTIHSSRKIEYGVLSWNIQVIEIPKELMVGVMTLPTKYNNKNIDQLFNKLNG